MNKGVQINRIKENRLNQFFSSFTGNKKNLLQIYSKQSHVVRRINPYNPPINHVFQKQNLAFIRLLNVLPNHIKIDININNINIISNLTFKDATGYLILPSGVNLVEIYHTNDRSKPIHFEQINLLGKQNYTIAIGKVLDQISLFTYLDNTNVPFGEAKIRFINLSRNSPNLDFAVKSGEGDVVYSNVSYGKATEYLTISPMTVNLEIRKSGTKSIIFPLYKTKFDENIIYDLISVGCTKEPPSFEVIKLLRYI